MTWAWTPMGNRKHLIINGRVLCDGIGMPSGGDPDHVMPCVTCIDGLLSMEKAAFAT